MNFVKKNFSVVMNLISVLFVIVSIGSITSRGLNEGRNTFSKTISFSSKPFNREHPKVCVNLQTDVRYNYSVWRLFLWQEKKTAHKKQQ